MAPPSRVTAVATAAVALVTAAIALWANRELSSDIYFLLAGGREILQHGLPRGEVFATLNAGGPWLFQQWGTAAIFYVVELVAGLPGLEVGYALVIGAALVPLVWGCRDRSPVAIVAAWALLVPTLVAVLDPRAAGFSLLAFSVTVVLVTGDRRRWRVWLLVPLFVVWANLHAAFAAGMLLVALIAIGSATDRRRLTARRDLLFSRRFVALGLTVPAVLMTPLGRHVVDYMRVLATHRILPVISFEWQPTWWHPALVAYVLAAVTFTIWLWRAAPAPRRLEPLIVVLGFCAFAMTASRHLIWLGPVTFYALRTIGTPGSLAALPVRPVALVAATAAASIGLWLAIDAPRPAEAEVLTPIGDYAVAHPPSSGRLLTTTGLGSYILWRDPRRPITIDGRLENYSADDIDRVYAILRGDRAGLAYLDLWNVGGVITSDERAIAPLAAHGFLVAHRGAGGIYLTRGDVPIRARHR